MNNAQLCAEPVGMEGLTQAMPPCYREHHQPREGHREDYDNTRGMLPPGGGLGLPTSVRLGYLAVSAGTGVAVSLVVWGKTESGVLLWFSLVCTMGVPLAITAIMGNRFQQWWSRVKSGVDR